VVDGVCGLPPAVAWKHVDVSVVAVGAQTMSVEVSPVAALTGRRDHHPWP